MVPTQPSKTLQGYLSAMSGEGGELRRHKSLTKTDVSISEHSRRKPLQLPLPPGSAFLLFPPPHSSDAKRHFREDWLSQLSQQLMKEWNAFNTRFPFNTKGGCVAFQLDVHICH